MNIVRALVSPFALLFVSGVAIAGSMDCGSEIIQDEQREPVTRPSVIAACGQPDSSSGDVLIYEQDDARYRLRFNANDELESLTKEID